MEINQNKPKAGLLDKLNCLSKAINVGMVAVGALIHTAFNPLGTALITAGAIGFVLDKTVSDPIIGEISGRRKTKAAAAGNAAMKLVS